MSNIINLTQHTINVFLGEKEIAFPSEGLARVKTEEEEVYVTRDFWHFYKAEECTPDTFKRAVSLLCKQSKTLSKL